MSGRKNHPHLPYEIKKKIMSILVKGDLEKRTKKGHHEHKLTYAPLKQAIHQQIKQLRDYTPSSLYVFNKIFRDISRFQKHPQPLVALPGGELMDIIDYFVVRANELPTTPSLFSHDIGNVEGKAFRVFVVKKPSTHPNNNTTNTYVAFYSYVPPPVENDVLNHQQQQQDGRIDNLELLRKRSSALVSVLMFHPF
jgi:hypothetical protein